MGTDQEKFEVMLKQLSTFTASEAINYAQHLLNDYGKRPIRPIRPTRPMSDASANAYRKYADELELWQTNMEIFTKDNDAYKKLSKTIQDALHEHLKSLAGLLDIPVRYRDKIWTYAYRNGHSSGMLNVHNIAEEIVDVIFDE